MEKCLKLLKHAICCLFLGVPAFLCAMLVKIFVHDLWMISECGNFARDNGYWLFKYIRENHSKQKVVYVLDRKSPDYEKVKILGKVCGYQTFSHWFYYFLCSKEISTNPHNKPGLYLSKHLWFNKTYFIQHGIIRDYVSVYDSKNIKLKLFVTAANLEHYFILNNFGFDDKVVKLLGVARYDNLFEFEINTKQILIMPTWREYLRNVEEDDFVKSEYYIFWKSLLENEELNKILKQQDKYIVFYIHNALQKFNHLFSGNERIIIAKSSEYDIQTLLKESSLLITDYSSVFFDFAYMKKPVLWYLFDKETYFKDHHKKGYFREETSGLGQVIDKEIELIEKIKYYCKNEFKLEQNQIESIEKFYAYYDNKNCERIYKAIKGV